MAPPPDTRLTSEERTADAVHPLALACLGAAFAVAASWVVRLALDTRGLNVDDAYIHLDIARNWAEGRGPVFNPGEHVEASTSPAWLAVTALGLRLGLSGPAVVTVLEALFAAAAGAFVSLLARPAGTLAAIVAPLLFAALPAFATWSASGLETPMAGAALAGTVWLSLRVRGMRGMSGLGLCTALLAAVRPEMMALAPLIVGLAVWRFPREERVRAAMVASVSLAVPVASLLLARHAYYGMWVPNTYVAKVGDAGLAMRVRGARYVLKFLVIHVPLLAGIVLLHREALRRYLPHLAVAGALLVAVAWAGGDHFYYQRLAVPALTLLCLPLATAVATATGGRRVLAGILALAQAPLALFLTADMGSLREEQFSTRLYEEIGDSMNERLPSGTLATIGIGALGWVTRRSILDMVGLADPVIARSPRFPGAKSGHEHGDADYVMRRSPDFVLLFTWPTDAPVDDAEELRQLSTLRGCCQAAQQLLSHPHFRERYEHFDLPVASGKHQRMWRRRDEVASP